MNTGKIFAESEDIYQDQARVLFSYYKAAAEKIVNEEIDLEKKISEMESERDEVASKRPLNIGLMIGFLVVGIIFTVIAHPGSIIVFLIPSIIFLVKMKM